MSGVGDAPAGDARGAVIPPDGTAAVTGFVPPVHEAEDVDPQNPRHEGGADSTAAEGEPPRKEQP